MLQPRGDPDLALEPLQRIALAGQRLLERDGAAEPGVEGVDHAAHAAASDLVAELVARGRQRGRRGQRRRQAGHRRQRRRHRVVRHRGGVGQRRWRAGHADRRHLHGAERVDRTDGGDPVVRVRGVAPAA
jgi:hypothetical protein